MIIACAALIIWCLILTFVTYGQWDTIKTLVAREELSDKLHRQQQAMFDQLDRDITRLEDRTREVRP